MKNDIKEFLLYSNLDDKNLIITVKGKTFKFSNVAEKQILNKTQLLNQTILITRREDNKLYYKILSNRRTLGTTKTM